jgi:hypothetical protein
MDILWNIEFDYDGNEFQPLCVCNHVSELDPVLLTTLFDKYKVHYRFVSDERIKRWPIIGPIADHYDTIYITRDKRGIEQLKQSVNPTDNVCIFPEGTLYYKDTVEKSNRICDKLKIPRYANVLCPKLSGFECLQSILQPTYVTDITLDYKFDELINDAITIPRLMLNRPKKIVIRIRKRRIKGDHFLLELWRKKDRYLEQCAF